MRKTFLSFLILALANPCFAKYSGGTGEPADPYRIANVADFNQLSSTPADFNKTFILISNINLTGLTFTQAPIAPDTNSVASGFQGTKFTGVFDGNSHIISNLTITASTKDYIGLFGFGGTFRNLGIENVNVTGRKYVGGLLGTGGSLTSCYSTGSVSGNSYVGGLVGGSGSLTSCYATGSVSGDANYVGGLVGGGGSLTSCYSTGSVSGDANYVGGLAGSYLGSLTSSCYATGSVTGNSYVGGLVGSIGCQELAIPTLTYCYATGSVSGNSYVGGLVGRNSGTLISCYSTGSVSGDGVVGGLVGWNLIGTLTSCYATGLVTGNSRVGGLVGWNHAMPSICYTGLDVTDCYANGSVAGNSDVGGLVGSNVCENGGGITISNCYSTGSVTGDSSVGGLVGSNIISENWARLTITSCFWDIDTSNQAVGVGQGTTAGVTGKTTEEMKTLSTFTSAGWDFTDSDGDPADWMMPENSYPRLAWEHIAGNIADLNGDGVVDYLDLAILIDQWLFEEIPADLAPLPDGDGIVDFADFSFFANQWGTTNDIDELFDFTKQWLKIGLPICSADIFPMPDGDGRVNASDFAIMANDWLWPNPQIEQIVEESGESYKSMSLEVPSVEAIPLEEVSPSLPEQIENIKKIIEWSEMLWRENEDIRNMVDEEQWFDVMKSLNEQLELLEISNED